MKVLIIGYGNPGRLDDGLGPTLAERLAQCDLPDGVTVDSDYQLNVEDAQAIAAHDVAVLADATTNGPEPFSLTRLQPAADTLSFSTHSVTPAEALGLAVQLFGADVKAWVLAIRGYEFNAFGERLSETARANLDQALEALTDMIRKGQFSEIRPHHEG
ncbi:MAG: hydrogenase maturation protease [Planctomycetes bacterium]|jgi:hydrogenase maturation protease|nr:hydrogenase maturation protease [Planctomycetota bacterium]